MSKLKCRDCGFTTRDDADVQHGAKGEQCLTCAVLETIEINPLTADFDHEAVPPGCEVVWLPEATQAFASVLGRTALAIVRLSQNNSFAKENRKTAVPGGVAEKTVSGAKAMLKFLSARSAMSTYAKAGVHPDGAMPSADESDIAGWIRLVQTTETDTAVDRWLEHGNLSELDMEAIEKTGAYLD
jgi:hypothetical protein